MTEGERQVEIDRETIGLGAFLKRASAVASGGEAKVFIQSGLVQVNGQVEVHRARMLAAGDRVVVDGRVYRVVQSS